jgi:hypothetical protein
LTKAAIPAPKIQTVASAAATLACCLGTLRS